MRETKVTIKIPRPLYRKVEQVVEGSGFNSPTDFIVYVLRDLMGDAETRASNELGAAELDRVEAETEEARLPVTLTKTERTRRWACSIS